MCSVPVLGCLRTYLRGLIDYFRYLYYLCILIIGASRFPVPRSTVCRNARRLHKTAKINLAVLLHSLLSSGARRAHNQQLLQQHHYCFFNNLTVPIIQLYACTRVAFYARRVVRCVSLTRES